MVSEGFDSPLGANTITMRITHVSLYTTDLYHLNEIPSEFIEPYLVTFLTAKIEAVGMGFETPDAARADLKGVERFISIFGGIHARYATMNKYTEFCALPDQDMIKICKEVIKN